MSREIEVIKQEFKLTDKKIDVVLERIITKFGTSAKADTPKKYIGKRAYVIILK